MPKGLKLTAALGIGECCATQATRPGLMPSSPDSDLEEVRLGGSRRQHSSESLPCFTHTLTAVMSEELKELTREQVQKVSSGHARMMCTRSAPVCSCTL